MTCPNAHWICNADGSAKCVKYHKQCVDCPFDGKATFINHFVGEKGQREITYEENEAIKLGRKREYQNIGFDIRMWSH